MTEKEIKDFNPLLMTWDKETYALYEKLNNKKVISFIKEGLNKIGHDHYDYLLNINDASYSIIHFIKSSSNIEYNKPGWHIWIVEEPEEVMFYGENECELIQTATGEWGTDMHILTVQEIIGLISYFLNGVINEK